MKLNEMLKENRYSQAEVSKLTGIRQPTISAYCTNTFKMVVREHIEILCKLFNCSVEDLIVVIEDDQTEKVAQE
jgi:putative transcriptional regulator